MADHPPENLWPGFIHLDEPLPEVIYHGPTHERSAFTQEIFDRMYEAIVPQGLGTVAQNFTYNPSSPFPDVSAASVTHMSADDAFSIWIKTVSHDPEDQGEVGKLRLGFMGGWHAAHGRHASEQNSLGPSPRAYEAALERIRDARRRDQENNPDYPGQLNELIRRNQRITLGAPIEVRWMQNRAPAYVRIFSHNNGWRVDLQSHTESVILPESFTTRSRALEYVISNRHRVDWRADLEVQQRPEPPHWLRPLEALHREHAPHQDISYLWTEGTNHYQVSVRFENGQWFVQELDGQSSFRHPGRYNSRSAAMVWIIENFQGMFIPF